MCWLFSEAEALILELPQMPLVPYPSTTTTTVTMDRASQVLAQGLPPGTSRTYAALAEQGNVPLSTLHHRDHGRRSREKLA
jgi:hypothetical protein